MDQWILTNKCIHCGAPLYELHYPTGNNWVPTGDHKWMDDGHDCKHETAEVAKDEVRSSPNN